MTDLTAHLPIDRPGAIARLLRQLKVLGPQVFPSKDRRGVGHLSAHLLRDLGVERHRMRPRTEHTFGHEAATHLHIIALRQKEF